MAKPVKGSVGRNRRIIEALVPQGLSDHSFFTAIGQATFKVIDLRQVSFICDDMILDGDDLETLYENLLPFNRQIVAIMDQTQS